MNTKLTVEKLTHVEDEKAETLTVELRATVEFDTGKPGIMTALKKAVTKSMTELYASLNAMKKYSKGEREISVEFVDIPGRPHKRAIVTYGDWDDELDNPGE